MNIYDFNLFSAVLFLGLYDVKSQAWDKFTISSYSSTWQKCLILKYFFALFLGEKRTKQFRTFCYPYFL